MLHRACPRLKIFRVAGHCRLRRFVELLLHAPQMLMEPCEGFRKGLLCCPANPVLLQGHGRIQKRAPAGKALNCFVGARNVRLDG